MGVVLRRSIGGLVGLHFEFLATEGQTESRWADLAASVAVLNAVDVLFGGSAGR